MDHLTFPLSAFLRLGMAGATSIALNVKNNPVETPAGVCGNWPSRTDETGLKTQPIKKMNSIEITAKAKAFSNEGVKTHKMLVTGNTVSVWDSVAGHYTTCHSLSASAIRRIVALAR